MDLVAAMLLDRLHSEHAHTTEPHEVRVPVRRRFTRAIHADGSGFNSDRFVTRFWDYPRYLSRQNTSKRFDVFHLVDHSYSQLVHALPHERTVITCHDLDTFRSVLEPKAERRSLAFRLMTRRILRGFQLAAQVTCPSRATYNEILKYGLVPPDRLTVIANGVHPSCSPQPSCAVDSEVERLLGRDDPNSPVILHVGSTIARKRIDVLLETFARVRARWQNARLVLVGGRLTGAQTELAGRLGISAAVISVPFLSHEMLAGVYRRAAVLLQPSSAEGFGLPVVEAMACGTPVVASEIAVLREVGGVATTYCVVADIGAWTSSVISILAERTALPIASYASTKLALRKPRVDASAADRARFMDDVIPRWTAALLRR